MGKTYSYMLRHEKPLMVMVVAWIILFILHAMEVVSLTALFPLFAALVPILIIMLYGIFHVVHHADVLAEKLGEPLGTLILTLAVISVEVALIVSFMLSSNSDQTLARNTMFSVVMIAVNGYAGISLFWGGLKHRVQFYNLHGASAYLAALIPLCVICLIFPTYLHTGPAQGFSPRDAVIVVLVCVLIYAVFLIMQTKTHPSFFQPKKNKNNTDISSKKAVRSIRYHAIALVFAVIVMVLLSKQLSLYLTPVTVKLHLPNMLEGLIIAMLILMPEGYSAIAAAKKNQLQRSVNLCLGSALATICLTVPSVLIICLILSKTVVLGLAAADSILLFLTLMVSITTFTSRQTNFLHGAVHLSLFLIYIIVYF